MSLLELIQLERDVREAEWWLKVKQPMKEQAKAENVKKPVL